MAIARVQGNSANNSATSATIAVTISAVGSGNCVCGLVAWDSSGGETLNSVTDDKGNSYNLETSIADGGNQSARAFSRTNITNGPVTITANFSNPPQPIFRKIIVDEFSGVSTASTDERDSTAHGGQTQATPGTGTDAITSGTFTTVANGDLLFGACMGSSSTTLASTGTNFSAGTTNNTDYAGQTEFRAQTTAGSGTAATFTQAVGARRTTFLIAIKAVTGTAHVGEATFSGVGAFPTLSGFGLSPLQPDADSIDGTWTDQAGGTSLFAAIDEMSVDDADYIKSAALPVNDICKISLGNPAVTPSQPFIVAYRYEKTGVEQIDLGARLLQGTTEIAVWTHSDISTSFVTAEQTLSGGQFSAISDFNDLFIEFTANQVVSFGLEGDFSGDLTLEGDFSGSLLLEGT